MKKLIYKLLIVCFIFIAFLTSCNKKYKTEEDVVFINMDREPKTIDPTLNSMRAVYIIHAFEGLTRKDKNNDIAPAVAKSWEISDDGLTYTFYLRDDAKWSDGKILTAKDFEYGWRRAVDPTTGAEYSYMLEIVKNAKDITLGAMTVDSLGVKAIDDYTFEVTLENPAPYLLELISSIGVFMPIRKDIIEKYGDIWTFSGESYVCNGPYKMTERNIDKDIVFEINTNYWNVEEQTAKKIVFVLMDDENTVLHAIKNNDIYFSANIPPSNEIEKLTKEGYIVNNDLLGTCYIEINTTRDVLNDKYVRRALALSIDRNYIVSNIMKGGQKPAGSFVPYGFNDIKGDFRENGGDYINISKDEYYKNMEEAKILLEKAGYKNGEKFPVFSIKVPSGAPLLATEAMQEMWKNNLNVDVTIVLEDNITRLQSLLNKDYDMVLWAWIGDYKDPMTILDVMLSYSYAQHTGFKNKDFDNLILLAKNSKDSSSRMYAMHEAEKVLMEYMPIIPLYYMTDSLIVNPRFKGYTLDSLGRYKFNYSYIEK